ncbi:hypothetical protein GCM10027040_26300 [Halomonas shantousis]
MPSAQSNLSARDLLHDVIPKLNATEKLVNDTLQAKLEESRTAEEHARALKQQQEFQLEITIIRMNLDHLLARYANELKQFTDTGSRHPGPMLKLDPHESVAINNARQLYTRVREIQTG